MLETIEQPREAIKAYKRRVELGGWDEEVFEAQMRVVSKPAPAICAPALHGA